MERIAFIVNPIAGGKCKEQFVKRIAQVFPQSEGYDVKICYTQCGGHAHQMAASLAAEGFTKIIAVGGDGTINETACALCNSNATLGIVPYGSGNGLARHLGIPLIPAKALNYVKRASVHKMDICEINNVPFFCTAGVGFDALIGAKFAQDKKRGFSSYLKLIAKEIVGYRPETYKLTIDGANIERTAVIITFANAAQWGNNAWIAPHADTSDGLLDVVIIKEFALYRLPYLCFLLLTKRIDTIPEAEIFKCSSVVLERDSDGYIHYDGEPASMGRRIEVKIVPLALKVLC
jgi:YegS/Rv2252/BmrU family lipid kinase